MNLKAIFYIVNGFNKLNLPSDAEGFLMVEIHLNKGLDQKT